MYLIYFWDYWMQNKLKALVFFVYLLGSMAFAAIVGYITFQKDPYLS